MPHRIVQHLDTIVIALLGTSFLSNLINALSEIQLSSWLTTGSFILAVIVSVLKIKTFRYDLKIKRLQYKKLKEDDEKTHKDGKEST